ncbi:MAG TPA: TonB-dependent receptor, partial [Woeseiaceae bacterium]|nr:TonB-dependent receptor [Woeseiaceae bacterium]
GQSRIDQDTRDVRAHAARPVIIDRQFEYDQAFHGFEANLQRDFDAGTVTHRLGAGLEYRRTRTEELRDGKETGIEDGASQSIILGEEFPLRDFPVTDTDEWGMYVEDAVLLGDVTLIAAVRADRYALSPREDAIYREDNPTAEPVSLSESDLSPKLGLVWHATDRADLFLQYAHGFRAPPFDDANIGLDIPLFKYRAIPNPDLRSESSDGFDAGIRLQGSPGYLRLALFHTVYDDFIDSKARLGYDAASDRVLFQSRNIGEARISGIEGSFGAVLPHSGETLSIDGSFYAARGENRENGEALNSVGPAQAVLGFNWTSPDGRRQLRLATTLTDAWTDRDDSAGDLFEPPGYALFDLLFSQALGERSVLRAGLMNLTDRTWWQWTTVGGLPPADPLLPALAQPGRNLSIGIEWHW